MTRRLSWARTLQTIGWAGRAADRQAAKLHRRHMNRQLAIFRIFDGSSFGYRYRSGGMGRLAQYRTGWWREALDAARAEDAHSIVLRVDQLRWVVGQLEARAEGNGAIR